MADYNGRSEDLDTLAHVKEHVQRGKAKWDKIYSRAKRDLAVAAGVDGSQYSEEDKTVRGKNRATFSFPLLDKFAERLVGAYNNRPFGIGFEAADQKAVPMAQGLSGVIAGIESESNAKYAYRHALRNSATCGYGWLYVTTEYNDEYSEGTEVVARIKAITVPQSVLLDPKSVEIDGRDAEWAIHQDVMGMEAAKKEYGDSVVDLGAADVGFLSSMDIRAAGKDDTVQVITHFERVHSFRQVWYAEDGKRSKKSIQGARSKRVKSTKVVVTKIVGNAVVSKETLPIKCLPIIPVYGLPFYKSNEIQSVGVVHRAIDAQRLVNYAASLAAERLALSPKAQFMGPSAAINNVESWKNSARENPVILLTNHVDKQGTPIPQPIQLNNAVDLGDTIALVTEMTQLISQVVGMPAEGFGSEGPRQQTAEEALLRAKSGETVVSTFYENLASSIERLGYVLAELVLATYDTERPLTIVEEDGTKSTLNINIQEYGIDLSQLKVRVKSGPLLSTQRKENLHSYIALAQVLGPAYMPAIAPKLAASIDEEDPELVQQIKQISMMSLQQGNPAQAQQLGQENEQLKAALNQAQMQLIQLQQAARDTEIRVLADQAKLESQQAHDVQMKLLDQEGQQSLNAQKIWLDSQAKAAAQLRDAELAARENVEAVPGI